MNNFMHLQKERNSYLPHAGVKLSHEPSAWHFKMATPVKEVPALQKK